ncbi:hypothetical protein ACH4SP_11235 [Streptomyces sp. NPDC021093]|uniref:hypothetical protein n=1 Tax=Streptomyces sp. NPDC021093 TaxID=3365112 RepID=UPI003790781D
MRTDASGESLGEIGRQTEIRHITEQASELHVGLGLGLDAGLGLGLGLGERSNGGVG